MTRISLPFMVVNEQQRAASALASRYLTIAEAQRAEADILAFADDQVGQLGARIEAEALVGAPSSTDLFDRGQFEARLMAMEARAESLRQSADAVDGEVASALGELRQQSRSLVARAVTPGGGLVAILTTLLGSALGVAGDAGAGSPGSLPGTLNKLIVDAAIGLVESRAAEALAHAIGRRVLELRAGQARRGASLLALKQALIRVQTDAVRNSHAGRKVLPIDLVLDDDRAAQRLLRSLPAADWSDAFGRAEGLDEGTARMLIDKRVADIVVEVAQRPLENLVHDLLERSVDESLDGAVRNGSPLAPLRPREVADGCMGLAIGIPDASNGFLLGKLGESLNRAQDIVEFPKVTRIADEIGGTDFAGRTVRYLGVLTVEAISTIITDLYDHASDPTSIGHAATRDWELDEDLPALMTDARLCREIAARKVRGQQTARLERWLQEPSMGPAAPVNAPPPRPEPARPPKGRHFDEFVDDELIVETRSMPEAK